MSGGKWTKNGQHITFSISDPIPYSDYYTDSQLISHQLSALGMNVTANGIGNATTWAGDVANGTFDATIHWSNQGPNPYFIYDNWMDSSTTAPIGKPAAGDFGRFNNAQAQAALAAVRQLRQPGRAEGGHHQAGADHDHPGASGAAAQRRGLG